MIDVPILVKDALRDGRRLKNYRIEVLKKNYVDVFDDVYTFTSSSLTYTLTAGGTFHLYSEDSTKAFESYEIVNPNGGGTYQIPCPVGEEITDVDIGSLGADVQIVINGLHTSSLILKIFIETRTEEVVDFTIDNNNLVSESVRIDERMCSGDIIKYGLCEGSSIEFQYFEKPNIKDKRIRAYVEVQYESGGSLLWHTIPMGYFTISQCPRQASTGIRKALGYNKLKSEYLDAPLKPLLEKAGSDQFDENEISIGALQYLLLDDYQIHKEYDEADRVTPSWGFIGGTPSGLGLTTPYKVGSQNYYLWGISRDATYMLDPAKTYAIVGIEQFYNNLNEEVQRFTNMWAAAASQDPPVSAFLSSRWMGAMFGCSVTFDMTPSNQTKYYTSKYAGTVSPAYAGQGLVSDIRFISGAFALYVDYPTAIYGNKSASTDIIANRHYFWSPLYSIDQNTIKVYEVTDGTDIDHLVINKTTIPDQTTLRDVLTADYETKCQFGKLDRVTDLFSGAELNRSRLYPAETLYPADTLYPDGAQSSAFKSSYSKLWADEGNIQKWRNLVLRYKGLDENQQETEFEYTKEISASGTQDYVSEDNWILNNLIWTAADIETLATSMAGKMSNLQWFPFELWGAGLPYLETGDKIEITVDETTYPSYILQRQLGGIQNLQDTFINGSLEIF